MKSVAKSGQKSCSKGFHQVPSRPNSFKVVQIRSKEFQRVPRGSYDRCCQIWPKKSFQGVPRVPRGSIGYKGFHWLQGVPKGSKGFQGVLMKGVTRRGQKSCSKGFQRVPSRPKSFKVVQICFKGIKRVQRGSYERYCLIWPKRLFQGASRGFIDSIRSIGFQGVLKGSKGFQVVPRCSYERCCQMWPKKLFQGVAMATK